MVFLLEIIIYYYKYFFFGNDFLFKLLVSFFDVIINCRVFMKWKWECVIFYFKKCIIIFNVDWFLVFFKFWFIIGVVLMKFLGCVIVLVIIIWNKEFNLC